MLRPHDAVEYILSRYAAFERALSAPQPLGNAGGLSGASLWRFRSARGERVLRAWPADGLTESHLAEIHRWIGLGSKLSFIPVPVHAIDGSTLQAHDGQLWELSPWQPGSPDAGRPPTSEHIASGFAGLAAFHQVLASERTPRRSPGLQARHAEIEHLLLGGFAELEVVVDRAESDPNRALALRWIELARPLASGILQDLRRAASVTVACQPCLRDARGGHLLFEDRRLTGLVDFGAMGVETVAADLGRLLSEWIGPNLLARSAAFAAYEAIRPLDESELRLVRAFESSGAVLSPGHWVRWHFVELRSFDDSLAVRRGLEQTLARLEEYARH
jgi:homoserine kinase type II